MNARRYWWLTICLMGCALWSCAGGSGSSGFDITENAAINEALDTGDCQDSDGLVICPAATIAIPATRTPTPTRTPIEIRSATVPAKTPISPSGTPGPETTATVTSVPTPTKTSTQAAPTSTPAGEPSMQVHTNLTDAAAVSCAPTSTGACTLQFFYTATGFPLQTMFRTAVREQMDAPWRISEPTGIADNRPNSASFGDAVEISTASDAPAQEGTVQFAVLAFLNDPGDVAAMVESLGETHANFAYVLAPVPITVIP